VISVSQKNSTKDIQPYTIPHPKGNMPVVKQRGEKYFRGGDVYIKILMMLFWRNIWMSFFKSVMCVFGVVFFLFFSGSLFW